jgi:hypothetical protein
MNHRELSRRALAIGLVWGFWLFWVIAGAACLTTHEIERHSIVRGYDGGYAEPEYSSAGLIVAIFVWLIASVFPTLLEQWRYGKISRRCVVEFVITALISIVAVCAAEGGGQHVFYLACFVVMLALSYSCFRLRRVGLDYLEPLPEVDGPRTEEADATLRTTELPREGQQRARSDDIRVNKAFSTDTVGKRSRTAIVCGILLALAWLLLLFQAAGLVGILLAKYPRDPALSIIVHHLKYGSSRDPVIGTPIPPLSAVIIPALTFLAGVNLFALTTFLICLISWCHLRKRHPCLRNIAGITAVGSLLTVALGVFIAFLPS